MRFIKKLASLAKKAYDFFKELFKDKSPAEVVNDVSKTVVAVSTIALTLYAGINAVRVHLMKGPAKASVERKTGADYIMENRKPGSIDEKMAEMRRNTANIGKKHPTNTVSKEDLDLLKAILPTRNQFFRMLTPEEQLNVLKMEEFDFEGFRKELRKKNKKPLFPWGDKFKRLGKSPEDAPFWDPIDFGWLNFIMHPIDDFLHWAKNDPVPKRCPQIQLVDHPEIPNVRGENLQDCLATLKSLDSYLNRNKMLGKETDLFDPAEDEYTRICVEEFGRHKSLKKYRKAVDRRMAMSDYGNPNPLSIFDEIDVSKDKKKKKKKKSKSKKDYDSDDTFEGGKKDKKGKKKNKKPDKETEKMMSEADRRARELYQYHLKNAMSGELDWKGFSFKV